MAQAANHLETYFWEILELHWGEPNILYAFVNFKNSKDTQKLTDDGCSEASRVFSNVMA